MPWCFRPGCGDAPFALCITDRTKRGKEAVTASALRSPEIKRRKETKCLFEGERIGSLLLRLDCKKMHI